MSRWSGETAREAIGVLRPHAGLIVASAALGGVAGLSVAGLLAVINIGLHASAAEGPRVLVGFIVLCVLALVGLIGSDYLTNLVGQRIVAALRHKLMEKILTAPIGEIERFKSHRLVPVLTHDIDRISDFAFLLSSFVVSLIVTCGCIAYLVWLSPLMFSFVAVAISIGVAAQSYAQIRGINGFFAAREGEDLLQKRYRAISEGAKELRLNRARRLRLADQTRETIDWICRRQLDAINTFVTARTLGMALFFLVIGLTIVLRQVVWHDVDGVAASGFVLVLLYLRGPIDQVIGTLPAMGRCSVAFRRVADLSARFATSEPGLAGTLGSRAAPHKTSAPKRIELRGVRFAFPPAEGAALFALGPIDLAIDPGEILFIAGSNGSGKTTLIKLLLGLYPPSEGTILLDGVPVTPSTADAYRQLFTTIFSDYYLFEDLVSDGQEVPLDATRYLERLEMADKVAIRDGSFASLDLSTGQRKRLALLNAWLEQRPVLVFDEWAADQDPLFREIFYRDLLPDLRAMGKTIVAISHDDRYFDVADRVVRLDGGRIVGEAPPKCRRGRISRPSEPIS